MPGFAIRAEGLSKRYQINQGRRSIMLRQALQDAVGAGLGAMRAAYRPDGRGPLADERAFWALKDASFDLATGESLGIIGSNGAGKSTLLKILARVTMPTAGRVRLRGRVGSLLEVGTGFHSELTGRENVFLNGAILGMRKREIESKFDEIVDFSGVEDFLDTPVKFYSSGMRMRLAFSVAAHLEPEILLIDEILAVGDIAFQNKSLNKMKTVARDGRTVLFVSHNMAAVRALCRSAIYIDQGRIVYMGDVASAIDAHVSHERTEELAPLTFKEDQGLKIQLLSVAVEDGDGRLVSMLPHDQPFWVRLKIAVRSQIFQSHLALHVLDSELNTLATVRDVEQQQDDLSSRAAGTYTFRVRFPAACLVPGNYWLGIEALQKARWKTRVIDSASGIWPFEIFDNGSVFSRVNLPWSGKFILPAEWHCVAKDKIAND